MYGEVTGKSGYTGSILGSGLAYESGYGSDVVRIKNCYYLTGTTSIGHALVANEDYPEDVTIENLEKISSSDLKLSQAVNNLNQNGYSEYKKDESNINEGYPILKWQ